MWKLSCCTLALVLSSTFVSYLPACVVAILVLSGGVGCATQPYPTTSSSGSSVPGVLTSIVVDPEEVYAYFDPEEMILESDTAPILVSRCGGDYALAYAAITVMVDPRGSWFGGLETMEEAEYEPTVEDLEAFRKLTADVIWYQHAPKAKVVLVARPVVSGENAVVAWELTKACPYKRLEQECTEDGIHQFPAGDGATEDPRTYLGKVDAPCGNGVLLILSSEAIQYLRWLTNHGG